LTPILCTSYISYACPHHHKYTLAHYTLNMEDAS